MNPIYRVIQAREQWNSVLDKFESKDIYFEYDYFSLHKSTSDIPTMVYLETDLGKMSYPFLLRDISYHPNFEGKISRNTYYDIGPPFGYTGPLIEPSDPSLRVALIELFYKYFSQFCHEHQVVSEFVKFSHFLKNHIGMDTVMDVTFLKKMVVTDLQSYGDPLYGEVKKRKRKSYSKRKKEGLKAIFQFSPTSFESQIDIYYETMKRTRAHKLFYFSKEYFVNLFKSFPENTLLVSAFLDEKMIGFELCLLYDKRIHAHIGGTLDDSMHLSPSDLISVEVIKWGYENGYMYYHTGGGFSSKEDDSLYLYKKAFAKNSDFDFYLGKKIWNKTSYDYLLTLASISSNSAFFPSYRIY